MRIGLRQYNDRNYYEELNRFAGGRLYQLLEELGNEPVHPNWNVFKNSQRLRMAQERVGEQFSWSQVQESRRAKAGSALGGTILEFLNEVEKVDGPDNARVMAETLRSRLGDVVVRVMNKQLTPHVPQVAPAIEMS